MTDAYLARLDIYWIGGSPCSGKSTIAERLAVKYGLTLYHSDTNMFRHVEIADPLKQPLLYKLGKMSWNEIWMRPVETQTADEFEFYREEFELLMNEIMDLPENKPIIAEGTAWLPELLIKSRVNTRQAIFILPTKEFKIQHYSRRFFIQEILAQCEDPRQAFHNWMERDAQFAEWIFQQSQKMGFQAVWIDGKATLEDNMAFVENYFSLSEKEIP